MQKSQWIAVIAALGLIAVLFFWGSFSSKNEPAAQVNFQPTVSDLNIDTILHHAKEKLSNAQNTRLSILEQSVIRGDIKAQKLSVFHQLVHFWKDTAQAFEPYAWYEAEAARLENSEKTLTFAAHLFLNNLRNEESPQLKKWKALQAKDLFERSLKINTENDSSQVGLGACYIFGGISENPMEGIQKILKVVEKDSTNVFAQMILGHGSVISGQYDKAIARFERVFHLQSNNLEAILMLAEVYERKAEKLTAINWYRQAKKIVSHKGLMAELDNRIENLSK